MKKKTIAVIVSLLVMISMVYHSMNVKAATTKNYISQIYFSITPRRTSSSRILPSTPSDEGHSGSLSVFLHSPISLRAALRGIGFVSANMSPVSGRMREKHSLAPRISPDEYISQISQTSRGSMFETTETTPRPPSARYGRSISSLPEYTS